MENTNNQLHNQFIRFQELREQKNITNIEKPIKDIFNTFVDETIKIKEVVVSDEDLLDMLLTDEYSNYSMKKATRLNNERNMVNMMNYLFDMEIKTRKITVKLITEIYALVVSNEQDLMKEVGNKVNIEEWLNETPCSEQGVQKLKYMLNHFNRVRKDKTAVETAVKFHNLYLEHFPNYIIGNGQTARVLMNYMLIITGYLPYITTEENIKDYEETIAEDAIFGGDKFTEHVVEYQLDTITTINNSVEITLVSN